MCLLTFLALFLTIVVTVVMMVFAVSLPIACIIVFLAFGYWVASPNEKVR